MDRPTGRSRSTGGWYTARTVETPRANGEYDNLDRAGDGGLGEAADDLEATQEIEVEAEERGRRGRRWPVAAAVLAGCVLVALLAVWIGWRPVEPAERTAPAADGGSATAAPTATGRLLVDAAPWGEVVRVQDAGGGAVELPPERSTPLVLDLPAGRYTVELVHPDADAPASCEVEVVAGGSARCSAVLHRLDAREYFRQAGWWR